MDQFDTTPVDPRLARPVLPVANGAPTQPDTPAVLPRVPVQSSQPQQTQGLAFPQVGVQGRSPAQEKLANTQEMGSGISRIHNPVLKTLATVGDVLAGTFAPRAEQLIPGTEGNHALRLAQAGNAVKSEQEQQLAPVERRLRAAQATEAESLPDLHQAQAELNQRKQRKLKPGIATPRTSIGSKRRISRWRQRPLENPHLPSTVSRKTKKAKLFHLSIPKCRNLNKPSTI